MAKKRKTQEHSRFVPLEHFLLSSPAWTSLGLAAKCSYLEIAKLYDGQNNGRLAMSARMLAERLAVSRATAFRALRDLELRGFIASVRPSGFNLKSGERRASEWRLTRYHSPVGNIPGMRDFMRWRPGEIQNAASPESHRSFTREPQTGKKVEKLPVVALSRSRQAPPKAIAGFTREPLIESSHVGTPSEAQRGAALKGASAPASGGADSWVSIATAALPGLAFLTDRCDSSLQSFVTSPPVSEAALEVDDVTAKDRALNLMHSAALQTAMGLVTARTFLERQAGTTSAELGVFQDDTEPLQ